MGAEQHLGAGGEGRHGLGDRRRLEVEPRTLVMPRLDRRRFDLGVEHARLEPIDVLADTAAAVVRRQHQAEHPLPRRPRATAPTASSMNGGACLWPSTP